MAIKILKDVTNFQKNCFFLSLNTNIEILDRQEKYSVYDYMIEDILICLLDVQMNPY